MNNLLHLVKDGFRKRSIIISLAKRNFYQQYFGSALGFFWAFIEPLTYIIIIYGVFTIGFRPGAESTMPFAIYFITGMTVWLYFSKTLGGSPGILSQYTYLVNSTEFNNAHLPIISILGNLFPHIVFIILCMIVAWTQGFPPSFFTLQLFYYLCCMVVLLIGLAWFTASTNLFVKDIAKVVNLVTLFGFWLTPIFWNISAIPEQFQWLVKLNPVFYIVRGYRESIVEHVPFWSHQADTIYFWTITLLIFAAGNHVFRKLEPHFGDVL